MKKSKKNSLLVGHRLLSFVGVEKDKLMKEFNVWRNHGLFASRSLASSFARDRLPGKKIHIEGVRVDTTPIEAFRKDSGKDA